MGENKRKNFPLKITAGILLIILIIFAVVMVFDVNGIGGGDTPIDMMVTEGATLRSIARDLKATGIIQSNLIFRLYARTTGNGIYQMGMHSFTPSMKYKDIIGVAVRTLIRCVDRHMYIGKAYLNDGIELKDAAVQEVEGEGGYVAGFMEQYGGLLKTASIFGQEDFKKVDIDALDAAGEFLNCVNGLHASALSKNGLVLELLPPNLVTDKTELLGSVCVMPMYIKGMSMAFIVKE